MNMADGEVRTTITDPYMDEAIELPIDMEWTGEQWSEESDMDSFVFAFYRTRVVLGDLEYSHRYQFMAMEFTGLDPNLRGN